MIGTVEKVLKKLPYKFKWQTRPRIENNPVISFHFFNEENELFGDGDGLEMGGELQVDVFSKNDYSKAVKEIRAALEKAKFRFSEQWDDIEEINSTEKIYHKIILFNFIESEVMNG